jgi:dipeptidyl aminopeptidase/acylaminoacyl peptidase
LRAVFRRLASLSAFLLVVVVSTAAVAAAEPVPASGSILAPAARQAAWLSLEAPRPRALTHVLAPSFVADVNVSPNNGAVVALYSQFGDQQTIGGDLMRLDLTSGEMTALVKRASSTESLAAPTWLGPLLAFDRADLSAPAVGYAYQAAVRYPTRVEVVEPDGAARRVLIENARQASPSPDGTQLVFLRDAPNGAAILVGDGVTERELLPAGSFVDVASPKFSPDGRQIAFVVTQNVAREPNPVERLLGVSIAHAHGLPFDVWIMAADGSDPRLLAAIGADDPSLAWSPDGTQLFAYAGTGSSIVEVASGDVTSLPYIVGYGGTVWLP